MSEEQRWRVAQQHEREYFTSGKNLDWGTPHSLEYWKNFLRLDDTDGTGVEVGCGPNGISRFADNIVGVDPLDYSGRIKNFIQGTGENLPFSNDSVDFVICCNVLDHCLEPQKVMDEMFRISHRIIIWTYTHPRVISMILCWIDKTHPYRFTKGDVEKLLVHHKFRVTKSFGYNFDTHLKYVRTWKARLKLLVGRLLGVRGFGIHIETKKDEKHDPKDRRHNSDGVKDAWISHWESQPTVDSVASPIGIYLRARRLDIIRDIISGLDQGYSVVDLGCGAGTTLDLFRKAGFNNSIGIDFVQKSLERCKCFGFVEGKDVFFMDAGETIFQDQRFDIVFSEGLWEHFPDPRRYIVEAARICKKYIIVIQPNHYTLFGRLMLIGWNLLRSSKGGVKEYSFRLSYFEEKLRKLGFRLVRIRSSILKEQAVLVFKRMNTHSNPRHNGFQVDHDIKN